MSHQPAPAATAPQALCNLPYQYAPRLQQLVHRNLNFVNPATRVRRAGQDCLDAMVSVAGSMIFSGSLSSVEGWLARRRAGSAHGLCTNQMLYFWART